MAEFTYHCEESIRLFGKAFEEVHRWLDEFAGTPKYGMRHRKMRHNLQGIMEAEKIFGPKAGSAAKQHIITDLKEEGWVEEGGIPKDEKDYVSRGFF